MILLDTETYSATDIKAGVYRYVEDDAFEILLFGWSVDHGPVQHVVGEDAIRELIPLLLKHRLVAQNVNFDRVVLGTLDRRLAEPHRWVDTLVMAAEAGYPRKLEKLAKALGAEEKDSAGTRLINLFSKPVRGKRVLPEDKPEQWQEFIAYLEQDVSTLVDVHRRLPKLTEAEQKLWVADQLINDRGIAVDLPMARQAMQAGLQARETMLAETQRITGVNNPNSVNQLGHWLEMPSLNREAVEKALETATGDRRRVLQLRQELSLSAWNKYKAALDATSADGRLRGQFRFYGAHTGRWAGNGVQLHNLPKEQAAWPEGSIIDLAMGLGADPLTLKGLIRSMFVGPFVVVDYNAIEARVLAWLAGEQWTLDAFTEGRDIYVETADRMLGALPSVVDSHARSVHRSKGKVAVLALGYNGGVGALRRMGAEGTDIELDRLKFQWRDANQHITGLWRELDRAFLKGGAAGPLRVERDGRTRHVVLPSGRSLTYHGVRRIQDDDGRWRTWFTGPLHREDTYGGKLCENATQAVARDILADAIVRLQDLDYVVVGHVHDEVIVEGDHDPALIEKIMCDGPSWSKGLPLAAKAFKTSRYRKD